MVSEERFIGVPEVFDLGAADRIYEEVRGLPPDSGVTLDFSMVRDCQAFVLATLLTRLVAQDRSAPIGLAHLQAHQRTLLGGLLRALPAQGGGRITIAS